MDQQGVVPEASSYSALGCSCKKGKQVELGLKLPKHQAKSAVRLMQVGAQTRLLSRDLVGDRQELS